uniref:Glycoprotein n=1 Tax=Dipteran phenui-related virus OKIAV274 TaxID=2746251 RepID=A0A7D7F110_9VIRU|nr:glycoprotein [Dipteran phenui-related virus OKIAV274]
MLRDCGLKSHNGIIMMEDCHGMVGVFHDGVNSVVTCAKLGLMELVGSAVIERDDRKCHFISDVQCKGSTFELQASKVIDCDAHSALWWLNFAFNILSVLVLIMVIMLVRYSLVMSRIKKKYGSSFDRKMSFGGLTISSRSDENCPRVKFAWSKLLISVLFCRTLFDYGVVETEACIDFSENNYGGSYVYSTSFVDDLVICPIGDIQRTIMIEDNVIALDSWHIPQYSVHAHPKEQCGNNIIGDTCGYDKNDCFKHEHGIDMCEKNGKSCSASLNNTIIKISRKYCVPHTRNVFLCIGQPWGCWSWIAGVHADTHHSYLVQKIWIHEHKMKPSVLKYGNESYEIHLNPHQNVIGTSSKVILTGQNEGWLCNRDAKFIDDIKLFRGNESWTWDFDWNTVICNIKEYESDGLCTNNPNFNPSKTSECIKLPTLYGSYELSNIGHELFLKPKGLWNARIESKKKLYFSKSSGVCYDVDMAITGSRSSSGVKMLMISAKSHSNLTMKVNASCIGVDFVIPCDGHIHMSNMVGGNCTVDGIEVKSFVTDRVQFGNIRDHVSGAIEEDYQVTYRKIGTISIIFIVVASILVIRCVFVR